MVSFKSKHFQVALKANAFRAIFLSMITFYRVGAFREKKAKKPKKGRKAQK
ncbi:MAG: hypothetical protein ACJAVO_002847 [Parvibaculaceae bacterium]|jgi:hypothetical protein